MITNLRPAYTDLLAHHEEFELGLELDSAEVRGVLMHDGQDWGYAVVDIRS